MDYEPRGKVLEQIERMRADPNPERIWPAEEVAKAMGIPRSNIPAYLKAALFRKLVYRDLENGSSSFSLQPFPSRSRDAEPVRAQGDVAPAWQPPKMTPPRGEQAPPARAPLPAPIAAAPAPIMVKRASATSAPEPEPHVVEDVAEAEEEAPPEFNARIWLDGDIDLFGLIELEDGSHRLTKENALLLRRRLAWGPL